MNYLIIPENMVAEFLGKFASKRLMPEKKIYQNNEVFVLPAAVKNDPAFAAIDFSELTEVDETEFTVINPFDK